MLHSLMKRAVLLLATVMFASLTAVHSDTSSVCGDDTRTQVTDPRIGKIFVTEVSEQVCTATLIASNCAVTAGHCLHLLSKARFGSLAYEVDPASVQGLDQDIGKDWAVLKFKKSPFGPPGARFGFLKMSFTEPIAGEPVKIAGYGEDHRFGGRRNFSLQEADGSIGALEHELFGRTLVHDVDTMGGNSGSAIIRSSDHAVIGIHTHSGCGSHILGSNMGTVLAGNAKLQEAIRRCAKD